MWYLSKVILMISSGIVLANIALELGIFRYLNKTFRPLFSFANISPEVAASAMARVLSPSAGYSTLAEFHRAGKVEEREVIITTFLTTFVYELLRIFKFYLPVAVPLLGFSLGIKYTAVKVGSGFLQSSLALIYSKFWLSGGNDYTELPGKKPSLKQAFKQSFKTLKRVIPLFILTYGSVRLLLSMGLLSKLASYSEPVMALFSLPGEASFVVATQFANVVAGFATAGELVRQGILGEEQALITLIAGLILSLPRIYLQHTAPVVASLFSRKVAFKIIIFKISVEAFALITMLWLVLRWS